MLRSRPAIASAFAVLGLALTLAACGSSDSGSNTTAAGAQTLGPFGALTSAQRACLKKEGVTLPTFQRQGQPPNGQQGPPPGNGQQVPPPGNGRVPPAGAQRRFAPNSAQAKKMRAAFAKCGITLQAPGQGQGPQTQTDGAS